MKKKMKTNSAVYEFNINSLLVVCYLKINIYIYKQRTLYIIKIKSGNERDVYDKAYDTF